MKKTVKNSKLALNTETIKTLDDKQLVEANGGQMNPTQSCFGKCVTYYTQCH